MGRDFTSPCTQNACPRRIRGWVPWDGEGKELSRVHPLGSPQQTTASEVALVLSGPARLRHSLYQDSCATTQDRILGLQQVSVTLKKGMNRGFQPAGSRRSPVSGPGLEYSETHLGMLALSICLPVLCSSLA